MKKTRTPKSDTSRLRAGGSGTYFSTVVLNAD